MRRTSLEWFDKLKAKLRYLQKRCDKVDRRIALPLTSLLITLFLSAGLSPLVAQTRTSSLNPAADSFVEEVYPDFNYGDTNFLEIANATNEFVKTKYGYLMFDLTKIPSGAAINVSQLRLYALPVAESHRIGVYYSSNNSWTEDDITWNNKPAFEGRRILWVNFLPSEETDMGTIFEALGYELIDEVTTGDEFLTAWENRSAYSMIVFRYHAFAEGGYLDVLDDWVETRGDEIKEYVRSGGCFIDVAKDSEDGPFVGLFGLSVETILDEDTDFINMTAGTPFSADLGAQIGSANSTFCKKGFTEPLPDWVTTVAATVDGYPVIVAGKYGAGYLVFATAEITAEQGPGFDPASPDFLTFWRNTADWILRIEKVEAKGWYFWDVTDMVQTALESRKLTIVLKSVDPHESAWIRFYSREKEGFQPELIVTWTPPPPPPPPPDIEGPVVVAEHQPVFPTPDDDVTVTCTAVDLLATSTYSFDTEIGPDWGVVGGDWIIEDGELSQTSIDVSPEQAGVQKLVSTFPYINFVLETKVRVISASGPPHVGLVFRFVDANNFYEFMLRGGEHNDVYIQKKAQGTFTTISSVAHFNLPVDEWVNLKVIVNGDRFLGYVNDKLMVEATDKAFSSGSLGLSSPFTNNHFDDVAISVLDGSGVKEVNLYYKIEEEAFSKTTMEQVTESTYLARIPRQKDGTTVSWYVEALDNKGNAARSETSAYDVAAPKFPWLMVGTIVALISIVFVVGYALRKGLIQIKIE